MVAPDGTYHHNETAAHAVPMLANAADELRQRLSSIPGVVVEHKRYAVAVHYRNAAEGAAAAVTAAVHDAGRRSEPESDLRPDGRGTEAEPGLGQGQNPGWDRP